MEQILDFGPVQFVEATDCLIRRLVDVDLPLVVLQIVVVDDDEDWTNAQLHCRSSLRVRESLVQRVPALILLVDRAENGEIFNLQRPLLHLDLISQALGQAAPDHVEEAKGFPLGRLKRSAFFRSSLFPGSCIVFADFRHGWVFDELKVQLGEAGVEVARIVHTLFEEGEL